MIAPPLSFSLRVTRRPLAHRRVALLPLPSGRDVADAPISASEGDYVAAFARFLSRNVAAGNPADDTRATYGVHVATWLAWCRGVELDVAAAATEDVEDVQRRDDQWALLVRGKGHDRLIYLRTDVGEAVQRYLEHRDAVLPDERGEPLFAAVGNRAGRRRLSRRGVRTIVDGHLRKLNLKRPGVSNHAREDAQQVDGVGRVQALVIGLEDGTACNCTRKATAFRCGDRSTM